MNKFETVQDLIAHLSSLPTEVKNSAIYTPRDVPDGPEFLGLSGTSLMFIDKNIKPGDPADEVWDEDDLVDPDLTPQENQDILNRFKKVLVLWFE